MSEKINQYDVVFNEYFGPGIGKKDNGKYCLYSDYVALQKRLEDMERILRQTVPERWKDCTCPVGGVQNYIGELEQRVSGYRDSLAHHLIDMQEP